MGGLIIIVDLRIPDTLETRLFPFSSNMIVLRNLRQMLALTLILCFLFAYAECSIAAAESDVAITSSASSFSHPESIHCYRDGNCLLIPVKLNGRSCSMLFDTGSDNITISRTALSELGVSLQRGESDGAVTGVGAEMQTASKAFAIVKIGRHLRRTFPVNIQEANSLQPIIGFNFFEGHSVTVDVMHSQIVLDAESGDRHSPDIGDGNRKSFAVSLSAHGNQVLIPASVNGCTINMLFDSGADGITFNVKQAADVHLGVPADASPEVHMGVGGAVKGVGFTVSECAIGALVKQNVKVSVIESPGMPYPLMGAEFLKDCTYTINKERSQITFERI
jgi:clan AA aspartic protease (TIGR02281 family)